MTDKPQPGETCPTCGNTLPAPVNAPLEPAFWHSVGLPETAPPPVDLEIKPFMTGSNWPRYPRKDDAA